ncbi:MAG: BNR-4 repeat-containing protein [Victivallales bacterium]|nr:BNR-4 repeat-containing protein [Victivallales bacterium]
MTSKISILLAVFAAALAQATVKISPVVELQSPAQMPIRIGGGGGMYLFVDTGQLNLEISAARTSAVRVVLFSPDRELLADTWFPPSADNALTASKLNITGTDLPVGIYSLQVNSVQDPLGLHFHWGFTTDCRKYVIENTRGHRDMRHTEPITLGSPEKKGRLFFPVQRQAFTAEFTDAVPNSVIRLLDNAGKAVAMTTVDDDGKTSLAMPEDSSRNGLWSLEFDKFQAIVELDELTRWEKVKGGEDSSELCHWTNDGESWFEFGVVRKMLRPFVKSVNIAQDCDLEFSQFNYDSAKPLEVTLAIEYSEGEIPFLTLDNTAVTIPPQTSVPLKVKCLAPAPGETRTARIRATARGVSSFSTVKVTNDDLRKSTLLATPHLVMPYRNPSDLVPALTPDREIPSGEPYFDKNGKAYCNNYFNTWYKENGAWHKSTMADGSPVPRTLSSKIGFDQDNRPYLVAKYNDAISLLWSNDGGRTFQAVPLPVPATFADLEVFTGHNPANYPPPVVAYFKTSGRTAESFWRETNRMTLLLPKIQDGKLVFAKAVPLTDLSIGISVHSGMAHSVVSVAEKVHVIWGEASDPKDKSIIGVPTYVATYDRQTDELTSPALVGYGPPANDVHNTPSIVADSQGYLHAFIGSHGDRFRYTRSLAPNSSQEWKKEEKIAEKTSMTYAGVVCDANDNLYLFYREWPRFQPYGYCAVLALRTKKAMDDTWSDYRVIARPFFTDYSVYYHKVTIGPDQKIYVSFQYYSTFWFFRNECGAERTLIESPDGASTWYFSPIAPVK